MRCISKSAIISLPLQRTLFTVSFQKCLWQPLYTQHCLREESLIWVAGGLTYPVLHFFTQRSCFGSFFFQVNLKHFSSYSTRTIIRCVKVTWKWDNRQAVTMRWYNIQRQSHAKMSQSNCFMKEGMTLHTFRPLFHCKATSPQFTLWWNVSFDSLTQETLSAQWPRDDVETKTPWWVWVGYTQWHAHNTIQLSIVHSAPPAEALSKNCDLQFCRTHCEIISCICSLPEMESVPGFVRQNNLQ